MNTTWRFYLSDQNERDTMLAMLSDLVGHGEMTPADGSIAILPGEYTSTDSKSPSRWFLSLRGTSDEADEMIMVLVKYGSLASSYRERGCSVFFNDGACFFRHVAGERDVEAGELDSCIEVDALGLSDGDREHLGYNTIALHEALHRAWEAHLLEQAVAPPSTKAGSRIRL